MCEMRTLHAGIIGAGLALGSAFIALGVDTSPPEPSRVIDVITWCTDRSGDELSGEACDGLPGSWQEVTVRTRSGRVYTTMVNGEYPAIAIGSPWPPD